MVNRLIQAFGTAALCLAGSTAQASWTLRSWTADPPLVTLNGDSTNSCLPVHNTVSVSGNHLTIQLSDTGGGCFSSGRPWTYDVRLSGVPAATYQVTVTFTHGGGVETMGTFSLVVPNGASAAQPVPAGTPAGWAALAVLLALGAATARRRVMQQ